LSLSYCVIGLAPDKGSISPNELGLLDSCRTSFSPRSQLSTSLWMTLIFVTQTSPPNQSFTRLSSTASDPPCADLRGCPIREISSALPYDGSVSPPPLLLRRFGISFRADGLGCFFRPHFLRYPLRRALVRGPNPHLQCLALSRKDQANKLFLYKGSSLCWIARLSSLPSKQSVVSFATYLLRFRCYCFSSVFGMTFRRSRPVLLCPTYHTKQLPCLPFSLDIC